LKSSYCCLLRYSLARISNTISLQLGTQASTGGPAGQEGMYRASRLSQVKSWGILAVSAWKLYWGGSWWSLCSPCMLHSTGGW